MLQLVVFTLFPALLIVAAASDLLTLRIPNWVSLALLALFVVVAPFAGLSWMIIGSHFALGLVLLLIGMGMFAMKLLGGGDAKLLAAIGLWVGWLALPSFLIWAAIIGGLLALMLLTFRKSRLTTAVEAMPWVARLHNRQEGIPYGVALSAGALIALPQTAWFALATTPI